MPRARRITIPAIPHHIIQRGNNRQAIFLDDEDYREWNPVRAGLVTHPRDYPWSSYHHRALGRADQLLDEDPWYAGLGSSPRERQHAYAAWVASEIEETEWDRVRAATQQGRVIAKEEFQKQVEAKIGRRLVGESRGRPRKIRPASREKVL